MRMNARTLFISLIATAVVGALLSIVQVWFAPMEWWTFFKCIATLVIIGVVASFLLAIDYDLGATSSKIYLYALCVLSTGAGALVITQIWMHLMPWGDFKNLLVTLLILAALAGFVLVAKDDFTRNKQLRDNNYID